MFRRVFIRMMVGLSLFVAVQAFAAETVAPKRVRTPEPRPDIPVPTENQAAGTMPSLDGADAMSKAIWEAIKKDDSALRQLAGRIKWRISYRCTKAAAGG